MIIKFLRVGFGLSNYPGQASVPWVLYLHRGLKLLASVLALFALLSLYANYISAPEFISSFASVVVLFGLILGLALTYLGSIYPKEQILEWSKAKAMAVRITVPIAFTGLTAMALLEGGPLALNYIFGKEGSVIYTVEDIGSSDRLCPSAVSVNEINFPMIDRICGVPRSLLDQLKEGDRIEVIGPKTPMGIRPNSYRLVFDR